MAFDCQSKREGRMAPWPLVALAVLAAMALLA
jgi:hypothetical protein